MRVPGTPDWCIWAVYFSLYDPDSRAIALRNLSLPRPRPGRLRHTSHSCWRAIDRVCGSEPTPTPLTGTPESAVLVNDLSDPSWPTDGITLDSAAVTSDDRMRLFTRYPGGCVDHAAALLDQASLIRRRRRGTLKSKNEPPHWLKTSFHRQRAPCVSCRIHRFPLIS